jgi:hypothetical protein
LKQKFSSLKNLDFKRNSQVHPSSKKFVRSQKLGFETKIFKPQKFEFEKKLSSLINSNKFSRPTKNSNKFSRPAKVQISFPDLQKFK